MQVLPVQGQTAIAGTTSQVTLLTRDAQGTALPYGGAVIIASASEGPGFVVVSVIDASNGSVALQFDLEIAGTYQVIAHVSALCFCASVVDVSTKLVALQCELQAAGSHVVPT